MYVSIFNNSCRKALFGEVVQGSDGGQSHSCVLYVFRAPCLCHGMYSHRSECGDCHYVCIYLQHCDKVIAQYYPEVFNKARGTFINALVITSGSVALLSETAVWRITMDRPEASVNCVQDSAVVTSL